MIDQEEVYDNDDGGIYVHYYDEVIQYGPDEGKRATGYVVALPHQCDSWEITGFGLTEKDAAVDALEAFIANANAALSALKTHVPQTPENSDA